MASASNDRASSLFLEAGGETGVRRVVNHFVAAMLDDLMIGFLFRRTTFARLSELEYQYAAAILGAQEPYRGRPLRGVHQKLGIAGGQFARRRQLLVEAMQKFALPSSVVDAWLAHTDALRPSITQESANVCHGRATRQSALDW